MICLSSDNDRRGATDAGLQGVTKLSMATVEVKVFPVPDGPLNNGGLTSYYNLAWGFQKARFRRQLHTFAFAVNLDLGMPWIKLIVRQGPSITSRHAAFDLRL